MAHVTGVSGRYCSILIASPNERVRRRWRQELKDTYNIVEISEFTQLISVVGRLKPSIVLYDLSLSRRHTASSLISISRFYPPTKTIVLASVSDQEEELGSIEVGARGYCNIDIDPVLLRKAVQVVQKGEIWIERSVVSSLVQKITMRRESLRNDTLQLSCLTPREREIASMVGCAASNKQIAVRLKITEATVKAHLTDIFRKLRIADRVELALLVQSRTAARI